MPDFQIFLLIKISSKANFSPAWIIGRLLDTSSEQSGPELSEMVWGSLPTIHAEEKLAFKKIFISKNWPF